jgi:hypothetical protein
MIVKIAAKEKRLAANTAWGPAMAIWAYLLHKGVTDTKPEQFNPFVEGSKTDNNESIKMSMGKKLPWMSKKTAEGIILAAEKKILPASFWIKISGIWLDIVATSKG